jgi:hypothetical protein
MLKGARYHYRSHTSPGCWKRVVPFPHIVELGLVTSAEGFGHDEARFAAPSLCGIRLVVVNDGNGASPARPFV